MPLYRIGKRNIVLFCLKVSLSFNASSAEPGDDVSIVTESNPDSLVLLSVSDSSLHLLAEACKSMSKNSVSLNKNKRVGLSCILPVFIVV